MDVLQLYNIDSTNMHPSHWVKLASVIRERYNSYDGFVVAHGTDTLAYAAATLSYLIQGSAKPIVVTGAQRPIDLPTTDARMNLIDSIRFAADDRAHDVSIVFGSRAIAGTRAKKERTKSYNAFASINYPDIAIIHDEKIVFYIEDSASNDVTFYDKLDEKVLLLKLLPGTDGSVLDTLREKYHALIIESFGVGGLPDYGDGAFVRALTRWTDEGRPVIMATQVTHEGSDMGIYQVGQKIKQACPVVESYDMTLEAVAAKTMWALGESHDIETFARCFYKTINHDLLFGA